LTLKINIKRSQPAAAPTGHGARINPRADPKDCMTDLRPTAAMADRRLIASAIVRLTYMFFRLWSALPTPY